LSNDRISRRNTGRSPLGHRCSANRHSLPCGRFSGQFPLDYSERHPIVLPRRSPLTVLLREAHVLALYGGPQLTRNVLSRHWILQANRVICSEIQKCMRGSGGQRSHSKWVNCRPSESARPSPCTLPAWIMPDRYGCGTALAVD